MAFRSSGNILLERRSSSLHFVFIIIASIEIMFVIQFLIKFANCHKPPEVNLFTVRTVFLPVEGFLVRLPQHSNGQLVSVLPFKTYTKITNSPFLSLYISYRSNMENLLKYQENLT